MRNLDTNKNKSRITRFSITPIEESWILPTDKYIQMNMYTK